MRARQGAHRARGVAHTCAQGRGGAVVRKVRNKNGTEGTVKKSVPRVPLVRNVSDYGRYGTGTSGKYCQYLQYYGNLCGNTRTYGTYAAAAMRKAAAQGKEREAMLLRRVY